MPNSSILEGNYPTGQDFSDIVGFIGITKREDGLWRYLDGTDLGVSKFAPGTLASLTLFK
jgi:hypothetical protein